jgi:Zn-dependent M28 family amino/carboxypeptidase
MKHLSTLSLLALVVTLPPTALRAHEWAGTGKAAADTAHAQTISEDSLPLDPRFSADRVKADVAFLSDDLLEGRETGSRGYEIAARFVASRFASLGLVPMGDMAADGTRDWEQRITFQKTERADGPSGVAITGPNGTATFAHGVDSLVSLNGNEPSLDVSAPLVFVGYGIESDRFKLHDYAGLDVKGKIVVLLRGYPEGMPSEEGAYFSRAKNQIAQEQGAIGVISIDTALSAKTRTFEKRASMDSGVAFSWIDKAGKVYDEAPDIRAGAGLNDRGAEALFAGSGQTLAKIRAVAARKGGSPKGLALRTSARIFGKSSSSRVTSPNIVAMLPGSDPTLKSEYVVLSGHLDHLGISAAKPGEPADKDRINNGALDNAAGSATTLEVARVLSQDAVKPRRSVIFLISTGEERGLLGAGYFATNPAVPIEKIVGNVDLDMPLLLYPFTDVIAFGADHSTLGQQVAQAVAPMKVRLSPDPMPQENIFVRSDHYQFVKQGVPAVFFATGYGNGGAAKWDEFLSKYYHSPADDMKQAINWRAGARFAEANYRVTRAMADGDTPPEWYQGDFFGDLFAPRRPKAAK